MGRYPHTAATAWTGLLFLYQFDNQQEVNPNANPFAPPDPPVPPVSSPNDDTCLPLKKGSVSRGNAIIDEAKCSAHEECASLGLAGTCCPTDTGMYLGCCSSGQASRSHFKPSSAEIISNGNACSANPNCPHLDGNCCPTDDGVCLG